MRKWRTIELGKYKLHFYERRTRHTGIGYDQGCGHDITEICHAFVVNGIEVWKKTVRYEVTFK